MKKLLIILLLLLTCGAFAAELHVTPYCEDVMTYARINKINVILWFIDDNDATYNMRDEILLNGQLIAATEDCIWAIVDNSYAEGLDVSNIYGVGEFPTVMCVDTDGKELYGSRLSYSLMDQNVLISDALLMSMVANNVIDWQVGDNWYDDRYVYNTLESVEYTYWNNKPTYDYNSDYYNDYDNYYDYPYGYDNGNYGNVNQNSNYNAVNILTAVLFLYRLYPALAPILSDSHVHNNIIHKTYISYREPPHVVIHYKDNPRQLIFAGSDKRHPNNTIHTIDEYERMHRPEPIKKVYTYADRKLNTPRSLTEKEKKNPVIIRKGSFYEKNTHSSTVNRNINRNNDKNTHIKTDREKISIETRRKDSSQVIVRDRRPINDVNPGNHNTRNINKPNRHPNNIEHQNNPSNEGNREIKRDNNKPNISNRDRRNNNERQVQRPNSQKKDNPSVSRPNPPKRDNPSVSRPSSSSKDNNSSSSNKREVKRKK